MKYYYFNKTELDEAAQAPDETKFDAIFLREDEAGINQIDNLVQLAAEGDEIHFFSAVDISKKSGKMRSILSQLLKKRVDVQIINEKLDYLIGEDGKIYFSEVFLLQYDLYRDQLMQKQRNLSKKKAKNGGKSDVKKESEYDQFIREYEALKNDGLSKTAIAERLGITRATLYRWLEDTNE